MAVKTPGPTPEGEGPPSRGRPFGLYPWIRLNRPYVFRVVVLSHCRCTIRDLTCPPELREPDIRRLVQNRIREGMLPATTVVIPPGRQSYGGDTCIVCGFVIIAGPNEVDVSGFHAHERCAVIWREESDRML